MTVSCIYQGSVQHRRRTPRHEFRYPLALAYVDLDELPQLLDGRLLRRRPGLLRFRRGDYLGQDDDLAATVRSRVEHCTGRRPSGPIRVLTQLRSFGLCFNPVSFYYCFDPDGERLQAILAEVTSTPWRERHAYVMDAGSEPSTLLRDTAGKRLHVSPFMGMEQSYSFRAPVPAQTLSMSIASHEQGEDVFDATLALRRRDLNPSTARWLALRYPFAAVRVLALIYFQALRLKLAGARVHPHPQEAA